MRVTSSCVVHLMHPASGLTLTHVASPDAKVDVGTIAAHFSLKPASLRFNGHFISRDAHYISGLTWRQLLTFFHSKGLNSGSHPFEAVRVEGSPLLLPTNEDMVTSTCEESSSSHDKNQNSKRIAAEFNPTSTCKRAKQESCSATYLPSMPLFKLKRERSEDALTPCLWNKRSRYADVPSSAEAIHVYEDNTVDGSKRQVPKDDASTERKPWKRLKEIRV